MKPQLVLLAGPDGAGKSTYYDAFLSHLDLPFLNADLLAAESGIDSFEAARILDAERAHRVSVGQGFVTETVFSDPAGEKLQLLLDAQAAGFDVTLVYIGVASPELSSRRIDQRIAHGGHDVPREKLAGRAVRSLENLRRSTPVLDKVDVFDNSSREAPYEPIATFERGEMTWCTKKALPTWTKGIIPTARKKPRKR
ncbi:MAG TPA: zeta toxin family protein [Kofleriaceae bacterium]|jgi:predicted ABC-type ATPase